LTIFPDGNGRVTSNPAGIDCGSTCRAEFAEGSEVVLTAAPAPGWRVRQWGRGCGGSTGSTCRIAMPQDRTASVYFERIDSSGTQHSLTIFPEGNGRVTSNPAGIDCGSTCRAEFAEGSEVVLTATPAPGWRVRQWGRGCGGSAGSTCRIAMPQDRTASVYFERTGSSGVRHSLTVFREGQGTVTSSPGGIGCGDFCQASFAEGSEVVLTADPAPGWRFRQWGRGCGRATGSTCRIAMPQARTASAYFERVPTVGTALENTGLVWRTGGNASWSRRDDRFAFGGSAVASGGINDDQSSWIETTITGPAVVSYRWRVSSEEDYDYLSFYRNGMLQTARIDGEIGWTRISGDVNWSRLEHHLPEGTHILRWEYAKDGSVSLGADRAWLDQVSVSFEDCAECPTMVRIPAGTFIQGSAPEYADPFGSNQPQRSVDVPAFAMGQTEVTFDQWNACVADGRCTPVENARGEGALPVNYVGKDDARDFARWLTAKTNAYYRLPSESEWEYATRAGTTTRFNTGDCITTDQANFDGGRPAQGCPTGTYRGETLPVASFAPNDFGLYDTHGNLTEWIRDCSNPNYEGAPTDGRAWQTGDCSLARHRGGGYNSAASTVASATRHVLEFARYNGFRVARLVPQTFSDCEECPTMVKVRGGAFTQGSPADESPWSSDDDEQPQRIVNLSSFAIGQTEVTFNQWEACVADGGCRPIQDDHGWGRGHRPVVGVSWNDAQNFVGWLSRKTGQEYRLPSESEWEYAARAGTVSRFNTGECITTDQANFDGRYPDPGCPEGILRDETVPVGRFAPNAFGLYDTHGNVAEWVEDCYRADYSGAPTDGSAWTRDSCDLGILRGGGWGQAPGFGALRSADRERQYRHVGQNYYGFRVARSLAR
jgi:formylglycine-generating enzyme required for sulfatase activity